MSTNPKNTINHQVDLCQYKSYTEDCLLKSITLARQYKDKLKTLFTGHKIPENRSFEDRVLLFICPEFQKLIDLYYKHGGQKMVQLYTEEDIAKIDNIILMALKRLFKKIFKPRIIFSNKCNYCNGS